MGLFDDKPDDTLIIQAHTEIRSIKSVLERMHSDLMELRKLPERIRELERLMDRIAGNVDILGERSGAAVMNVTAAGGAGGGNTTDVTNTGTVGAMALGGENHTLKGE